MVSKKGFSTETIKIEIVEDNPIPQNDPEDNQFKAHLVSCGKTKEEIETILALRKRAYGN
jgi:hypothetical protein